MKFNYFFLSNMSSKNNIRLTKDNIIQNFDQTLLYVSIILLLIGIVMVYSASISLPDYPKYEGYKNSHFLFRQIFFVLIGIFLGTLIFKIQIDKWQKFAPFLFCLGIIVLSFVFLPIIGKTVNGSTRWITIGSLNFQPSELLKLLIVFYAADFTVRKQQYMHTFTRGFFPMAIALSLVGGLILSQPDLGTFIVIVCISMGILFLGGFNIIWFIGISIVLFNVFCFVIWLSPWRFERLIAYLNPWAIENIFGTGYQLSHSLIAFGRGEIFGVGLGASVEKLNYLPEAHNDFILAVIAEELGLISIILLIYAFYWIVKRAFEIGRQSLALDNIFAGLVAKGIGIWIGCQVFINMGVNMGLLPTKGLTLPLLSYGGSGIVMNCIAVSILIRIDFENRSLMRGNKV